MNLRSLEQCCGSGCLSRIPDRTFFHPGSRICIFLPGSRIRIKEFKYFNLNELILSSRKHDPGSGSLLFTHPGSRGQKGTGSWIPGSKTPNPGSGSAAWLLRYRTGTVYLTEIHRNRNYKCMGMSCPAPLCFASPAPHPPAPTSKACRLPSKRETIPGSTMPTCAVHVTLSNFTKRRKVLPCMVL